MNSSQQKIVYCFLLICITLLFLWPLFRSGFIQTDDGDWMIIRLSAFYQSFREGQFPVRLLGRLNYSYGYPVSNFLYPGYLYIGSFIHAIGVPFVTTIKLIIIGSLLVSSISVFLLLNRFASMFASFIGALTFLFSPYIAFDIFRRGSVGEILAISMVSLALYSLESKKKHVFTISLALLILSHNSVALISLPFIFMYGLVRGRIHVFVSTLLALGLTCFFWIPALIERRYVNFDSIKISDPFQYFAINSQWLLLTIPHIVAAGYVVWNWKKETITHRFLVVSFFVLSVLTIPVSSLLWNIDSFTRLFQFPYRFLSLVIIIGALLTAIFCDSLKKPYRTMFSLGSILLLIPSLLFSYTKIIRTDQPETFYSTNEATTTVANEYMPRWVREFPTQRASSEVEFYKGKGTFEHTDITTNKVVASIKTEEDSIVQINSVYYPGWGVFLNGVPAKISYDNPQGVIRVFVPKGEYRIITEFRETVPRFIATIISLMSLLIFISAIIIPEHIKTIVGNEISSLFHESPEERVKKVRTVFTKKKK